MCAAGPNTTLVPHRAYSRTDTLSHELEWTAGTVRVRTAKSVTPVVPHLQADVAGKPLPSIVQPVSALYLDGHLEHEAPEVEGAECEELYSCRRTMGNVVKAWSRRSQLRMLYRLASIDWTELPGVMEMVTLTYPRQYPRNGKVVKDHLWSLLKRWQRKFGSRPLGAWKLEFQQRGAPHFHLYVGRPLVDAKGQSVSFAEFCTWLSQAWYDVVGSGDERHLRAGTGVDRDFCSRARSAKAIAWYFFKHGKTPKHIQNHVPAGFENVGRFWGILGVKPTINTCQLSTEEFIHVRRALVRFRRSALGRRFKAPRGLQGFTSLSQDPSKMVFQLLQLVRYQEQVRRPDRFGPGRARTPVETRVLARV